jgi:hypothetical protein
MRAVFVLFESLNRHMLGCHGGMRVRTPNFDGLAARCVRHDNHHAGSLPCMPARRDLLTGRLSFLHRSWGLLEPFAAISAIRARQAGRCGLLRPETTPASRSRSPGRSQASTPSLLRPDPQVQGSKGITDVDQATGSGDAKTTAHAPWPRRAMQRWVGQPARTPARKRPTSDPSFSACFDSSPAADST